MKMLNLVTKRFWSKNIRPFAERNRMPLDLHRDKRLRLARGRPGRPGQFDIIEKDPIEPTVIRKERKLPSLEESALPYYRYSQERIDGIQKYETFYDPLFNPHLYDEKNRVNPEEEPFEAIYVDSKSEARKEYTDVRRVEDPNLWTYVEQLARLKIAPMPRRRKAGEPIVPLPSGYVPPPETPPDLPYFVPRTRNHLLPVYYFLHSDPDRCKTQIKQVTGNLWKLEEDLRNHLESLDVKKRRILSSVQETDARIEFRGKHLQPVVDWLHAQGF